MPPTREKGRRGRRVANIIRQIVSEEMILRLNDPRLAFVTVTGVDLADDLRFADVRISILGDSKQQKDCLRALKHAHGHLQQKVAAALVLKFCPVLRFHLDESIKRSVSMSALIAQARAEDEANRADRIARGVEPAPLEPEEPMAETPPVRTEPIQDKEQAMRDDDDEFEPDEDAEIDEDTDDLEEDEDDLDDDEDDDDLDDDEDDEDDDDE
jgi:ribosome-binding factor A